MNPKIASFLIAACAMLACAGAAFDARAQAGASALSAVSALPVASVAAGGSAVAAGVAAVPLALSTAGAVLVVKSVQSTARGTLYVLERVSDGASASIEVAARGAGSVALAAGTSVVVGVVGAGVVLSAAGEAIAFVPNALGRALLHNERLTD